MAAWLLGLGETLAWSRGSPSNEAPGAFGVLAAALTGAALAAVPALAIAFGAALLLRLVGASAAVGSLERAVRDWFARADGPDRELVALRYARASAFVVAVGLYAAASRLLLGRLWRLQAGELGLALGVLGTTGAAVASLGLGLGLARLFVRPWRALDRRWPLPRPASALARRALAVVPLVAVGSVLLHRHRALLGGAAFLLWLGLLGAASGLSLSACRRLAAALPRQAGRARLALLVSAVVSSVIVALPGGASPGLVRATAASVGASFGATLLRRASDFDRDGAAAWAGGADCAPFDPKRSPLRVEIPGNEIDEDCDGTDNPPPPAAVARGASRFAPPDVRRLHVVWLIPDGVRADRLGAYGQRRALTPALDALAAESLRFAHAYAQSSATVFSFASMLIGRNPEALQWRKRGVWPQADDRYRTVAERFRALGYRTAVFTSGWLLSVYPELLRGYDTVVTPWARDDGDWSQHTSPMVTAQVIEHLEQLDPAAGPMFLTVHYNDPHFPYVRHRTVASLGARPIDLYDGEVAFTDRAMGSLVDYLRYRQPLWNDTVVVVASDHGEEFGEHGREHHARSCYRESTHVPLLLRVPGLSPGVIESPVALVDVAPTLLELVGAAPDVDLQGQSLLATAQAADAATGARAIYCAVASQYGSAETFLERAVRRGSYLLVEEVHGGRTELYDQLADPRELVDRAGEPALAPVRDELRALLRQERTGNFGDTGAEAPK